MDEIIYLEPDEEITSVIDKIKNAKAVKLGIVVPREASILQSVINLRLLSREASTLGKEIAIVTTDKIGRNLAAQIGLQVYNSIQEQTPIYQPPPPVASPDEVIEIDEPQPQQNQEVESESIGAGGVSVHHFQEKPINWKPKGKPIYKPAVIQKVGSAASLGSVNAILSKKNGDYKKFHKIIWPIAIVLGMLCALAGYLILPKAKVIVSVPSSDLAKQLAVAVSSQATAPNADFSVLPGKIIESSAEKEAEFPTTGTKNIGTKASGTITIYNNFDSGAHKINAGAKLSSSSKTFLTKQEVTVPGAGVQSGSPVPGTVKVDIEAENAGSEFNVKAGRFTITGLPANQQEFIYGQSSQEMSGGMSKQVQVVSQEDYDKAKNSLITDLQNTIKDDFKSKAGDKTLLEKAIVTPDPQITTTANVNSEAKQFSMKMNYKQQAMVYSTEELKNLIVANLQKQVSADQMVSIANDTDIGLVVDKTAYDKGELDLNANVAAKVSVKIDQANLKTYVIGKKSKDVKDYISKINGVSAVEVTFMPSWWFKRLPYLEKNISIQIQYINQTVQPKTP